MDVPNTMPKLNTVPTVAKAQRKKVYIGKLISHAHTGCHEHKMSHRSTIKNSGSGVSCKYCDLILF